MTLCNAINNQSTRMIIGINIYPDKEQIDTRTRDLLYSPSTVDGQYTSPQRRVNTIYLQSKAGRESSRCDFGTRVTPQRERKYNSANYSCHRKPLSAARICEIVSPPSLQKYIATRKIRLAAPPRPLARSQGERIRELWALAWEENRRRERQRERERKREKTRYRRYLFSSDDTVSALSVTRVFDLRIV